MMDAAKIAIKGSTQEHLEIADIRNDVVILKDGSVALILQVSAVNFGLLSEREQEAIIFAYAGMINSLNFTIEILIRSQKKDISHYLSLIEKEENKQKNPLLKTQIGNYRRFVANTVKENNVLDKRFYVVIPFSSLELGVGTTAGSSLGFIKKKPAGLPIPVEKIIEIANVALTPKKDHLLRQLGRLGLRAKQLTTAELTELFYEIYNNSFAAVAPQGGLNNSFAAVAPQNGLNTPAVTPLDELGSTDVEKAPQSVGGSVEKSVQDEKGKTRTVMNDLNGGQFEQIKTA